MGRILFENARLVDPEGAVPPGARLLVEGERIAAVLAPGQPAPDDAARIDLAGANLCPGFIDLHCHGSLIFHEGLDLADALGRDSASMARHGVTAFLATTLTAPHDALLDFVTQVASSIENPRKLDDLPGSQPIGIHLEGPWIQPGAAGAQPGPPIRAFDARHDADLLDAAGGLVKLVTFAPEIAGADELLAELTRREIVPCLGHSLADVTQVDDAVTRGARHVTHLFNAMGPLHHRAPGLAGAALADDRLTCDLICDGVHVDPRMVATAARAKGDGLVLISDRIDPPDPGTVGFGAGPLSPDGPVWRLPDGALAGSRVTLAESVANFHAFTGAELREAVAACSLRPARVLGIESQRGSLRIGARADLVVLGGDLSVRETWVAGNRVYPE